MDRRRRPAFDDLARPRGELRHEGGVTPCAGVYAIGLPFAGDWLELLNSDVYDSFPNAAPVGNGGLVRSCSEPLDGFSARAAVTLPANGIIVLARSRMQ